MLKNKYITINVRLLKIAVFIIAAFSLVSCVNNYTTAYLQTRSNLPQYPKGEYTSYVLQPNDEVSLRVLSIKDNVNALFASNGANNSAGGTNSYRIYADSTVDFPFMSHLKIGGLTIEAARQVVEKHIQKLDPNAKVMLALSNDYFYVLGEAGHGRYAIYKDKLNIFEALALSGDVTQNGNRANIRIIRQTAKGVVIKNFDIRSRSIVDSPFYYVYPNDIIYVSTAPTSFFQVNSFSSFIGIITTSVSFLLLVLNIKR
ncbi:polysaccharide biosynthesis/export family protein [Microbacter margulisiae]|uniref:Polysaccharide export outer membrane protein n=1 Tax=Microbacter margulisiae TaxID=1350067 RepID=A0A7W5DP63_9PORP|nr:polysaccharide biosynthesis/export family protein [Microbacter margulisiae]MBB3186461.1 polysaccharide export outer membrane protein [Microbacter margulisiae]